MKFLVNAPKRKRARKARFKKGSAAAKRYMASIRPTTKGGGTVAKRRKNKVVARKRARTKSGAIWGTGGVRPYRRKPAHRNPPRRSPSSRRHRRNPPGMSGLLFYLRPANLMGGVMDAGEVLIGKVAVRTIPGLVGAPTDGNLGLIIQGLSAVLAGGLAHTFVNHNAGKMVLAGGLAAPLESLIKALNIPMISSALGEETVEIDGLDAYPQIPNALSAYPQMGEDESVNQEAYSQQ